VFGGAKMNFDGARVPSYPRYGAPRWITTDHAVKLGEIMEPYASRAWACRPAR
jgi:cellulose synthase (UDP-forming)